MVRAKVRAAAVAVGLLLTVLTMAAVPATAEEWIKRDLGAISGAGILLDVAVGDGDNDGIPAVYVGDASDHVYEYLETKNGWSTTTVGGSGISGFYFFGVTVGDGDDDGAMEVFGGGYDPNTFTGHAYAFTWTGTAWDTEQMGTGGYAITDIEVGDADNDDRNEVFASSWDGHAYMYTYTGGTWNAQDLGNSGITNLWGVAVGDGDNDGTEDLFVTGRGTDQFGNTMGSVAEYNFAGGVWTVRQVADLGSGPSGWWNEGLDVDVGDADNDGSNEVYSSDYYASVRQSIWNSNNWRTLNMVDLNIQADWNLEHHTLDIGDGNADGSDEIYLATANSQIFKIWKDGSLWASASIGSGTGAMYGVAVGDGDLDPSQGEVYGASADTHLYQFFVDGIAPPNPVVWSDTHTAGAWSSNPKVHMLWKDGGTDVSGFDGYSFQWSTAPDTIPDAVKDAEEGVKDRTFTLTEGANQYFHIRARDNALNWNLSATHWGPVHIDMTMPTGLGILINGGAATTSSATVTLTLSGSDALSGLAQSSFSNDGVTWSPWEPFAVNRSGWDITAAAYGGTNADGNRTVWFRAADAAGNGLAGGVAPATDSIFLDRAAPTGLSLLINADAPHTASQVADLTVAASDPSPASGLDAMRFSNDGLMWGAWEPFATLRKGWDLVKDAGGSDTDGVKVVYLQVRDVAGNVGGPAKDTITLDRQGPKPVTITINGGADYTNNIRASLTLSALDPQPGTSVADAAYSNDGTAWSDWEAYATAKDWSLVRGAGGSDTDGKKTVFYRVRDTVGNLGEQATDTIFLDRQAPTGLSVSINGGASVANTADVFLTIAAADPDPASGVVEMALSADGGVTYGGWQPFQVSVPFTLSPPGDGSRTVHLKVRDRAGNEAGPVGDDIIVDTTPPVISELSILGITDTSATVFWRTNTPANSIVAWGTSVAYTDRIVDDSYVTTHSVTLTGLTPKTLYHLMVSSTDEAGNGPTNSADVTFTTLDVPDTLAPVITEVVIAGITDTLAVVTWRTNEPATTQVIVDTVSPPGVNPVGDLNAVLVHSWTITGLAPVTTYYLTVVSTDSSGNTGRSLGHQFTTMSRPDTSPPVISNLLVTGETDSSAVVSWQTDEPTEGTVEYGPALPYTKVALDTQVLTEHTVTLSSLRPSTAYHLRVCADDPSGNRACTGDLVFTTKGTADTTPPTISDVRVQTVTTTTALIVWRTDEPADSRVVYGLSKTYGLTSMDLAPVTEHRVLLGGLTPGETYHFQVASTDTSGNGPTKSGDHTFVTPAVEDKTPPQIANLKVAGRWATIVLITWETNELADGTVLVTGGPRVRNDVLGFQHSLKVEGLQPDTSYSSIVESADASGNVARSPLDFSTSNSSDTTPPVISGLNVTAGRDTITVSWATDEEATALVEYGTTDAYGKSQTVAIYLRSQRVTLTGLVPGTEYHLRVVAVDPSGNRGQSADQTALTTKAGRGGGGTADVGNWGLWLLLILALAGVAAVMAWRMRQQQQPTPHRVRGMQQRGYAVGGTSYQEVGDEEGQQELEMEVQTLEMGMDSAPVATLEMGEEGYEEQELGTVAVATQEEEPMPLTMRSAAGLTSGAEDVGDSSNETALEPVRTVRCPTCRTAIPVFTADETEIACPVCGKKGKLKPMPGAAAPWSVGSAREPEAPAALPPLPVQRARAPPRAAPAPMPQARSRPPASQRPGEGRQPMKLLTCSGCGGSVPIHTTQRPVRIQCPGCGKSGTLRT